MTKPTNLESYKVTLMAEDDICKAELQNFSTITKELGMKCIIFYLFENKLI